MTPLIEVRDLRKTFRGAKTKAAVDGVSFSISEGESLGLVGESGCGKSTIARLVARLIDADGGKILWRGADVTWLGGTALRGYYRDVQMVFQSSTAAFDPRRTIGYSVCEGLRRAGRGKDEIRRRAVCLLERCGLSPDIMDRYPHQVSGGQAQRAQIARALMPGPSLLICDETTSALDTTVQAQVLELLKRLQRETSLAMLFISHDLAIVQDLCDEVLVMHRGVVVESGTPDQVINCPQNDYTKALLAAYE